MPLLSIALCLKTASHSTTMHQNARLKFTVHGKAARFSGYWYTCFFDSVYSGFFISFWL